MIFISSKVHEFNYLDNTGELKELLESIEENNNQVHEAADLIYHILVLLEANGIQIEEVMAELKKRQNKSGLEEKANR